MTPEILCHKNYCFTDADLVIRAPRSDGCLTDFKIHRAKLASSSSVLCEAYAVNVVRLAGKQKDWTPVIEVTEMDYVWQAILGFLYMRDNDSRLENLTVAQAIAIWKAGLEYGLFPLVNVTERILLEAISDWTPSQALDLYVRAKVTGRSSVSEPAWATVEAGEYWEYQEIELLSLSQSELIHLHKLDKSKSVWTSLRQLLARSVRPASARSTAGTEAWPDLHEWIHLDSAETAERLLAQKVAV